jgi:predicted transcriptional regulator
MSKAAGDRSMTRGRAVDPDRTAAWLRPLGSPVRIRLLHYLTEPHYLEEIASHLGLARQAARRHVDLLVGIGVLQKRSAVRGRPVTEYIVQPATLFVLQQEFEALASLRPTEVQEPVASTVKREHAGDDGRAPAGPALTWIRGPILGAWVGIPQREGSLVIGRSPRCDVVISDDPYVSHRHARVESLRGRYTLTDLSSTNGTRRNWLRLPTGASSDLRHGDVVGIGESAFLMWAPPGESDTPRGRS